MKKEVFFVSRNYIDPLKNPAFNWTPGTWGYNLIDNDGQKIVCLNSNIFKIFSPELPLENGKTIDASFLAAAYIQGYHEGKKWFGETYKFTNETFRNFSNDIVKDLWAAFYEKDPYTKKVTNRWSSWLNKFPIGVSENIIKEFGFYAALYSEVIDLSFKYPTAFKDFFNENNRSEDPGKQNEWTALTYLLEKYFENDCKIPNDSQIENLKTSGVSKGTLKNKHSELCNNEYSHNGKKLSIKEFAKSYSLLIDFFGKENNKNALNEVEKKYKILKDTYPEKL